VRRLLLKPLLLTTAAAVYGLTVFGPSAAQAAAIVGVTRSTVTTEAPTQPLIADTLPAQPLASAPLAQTTALGVPGTTATLAVDPADDAAPAALSMPAADSAVAPANALAAAPQQQQGAAAEATLTVAIAEADPTPADITVASAEADSTTADLSAATVVAESHLPAWVQVTTASASLFTADTASDQVLAKLPRNAFLRVLQGGTSRLQVQAYDENGSPAQTGWVSAEKVLPSAPGTGWLVASTSTTLWTSSDASASGVRNISQFTPMVRLDGPLLDRIQVRVYRPDFSGVVDQGWVDVSATGPALPPLVRTAAPADLSLTTRAASSTAQHASFMDAAAQAARQAAARTGVPASVTVAQAILESDWGRSTLAQGANNYFGMKAMGTLGNDGVVWMPTSEYDDSGNVYQTTSAFRAYKSMADSVADHDRLLASLSRYAPAMRATRDPKQFASLIAQAGYSTDPTYADKLVALMDRYNLYSLDA
jgi:hypothetical protein